MTAPDWLVEKLWPWVDPHCDAPYALDCDSTVLAADGVWDELVGMVRFWKDLHRTRYEPDTETLMEVISGDYEKKLEAQIDEIHGPGAAAALDRAIADGSIWGGDNS